MNYKHRFITGISLIGVGVTFVASVSTGVGAALLGAGTVLMVSGLRNKSKWSK